MFAHGWSSSLHKGKTPSAPPAPPGPPAPASASKHHGGGIMNALHGALTRSKTAPAKGQRGLVGLQNLGNTCFMNSAIQCMSNTKELQEYFLSGVYHNELNRDNPLGMRGQVAEAFGQLIERLWHGSGSSVAPREFKQALARFAPQFSGYGQQDSQELLAFLLDGTHEDLNRIKVKPATEAPDWEGGGDKELVELAKTCWEQYRSRNDSVIVDLFQGQYRSTVVCPDCDKVSIKFDPFMYVTTNLPVTKKWTGRVFVIPLDPARGVLCVDVEVPKSGTIKTLKQVIGQVIDVDPKCLVLSEEWKCKFYKDWTDDENIIDVNTNNDRIIVYEVAAPYAQPRNRLHRAAPPAYDPAAPVFLPLLNVKDGSASSTSKYGIRSSGDDFGSPFILSLSADEATSSAAIHRAVARQYSRVTKRGDELVQRVEEYLAELEAGESAGEQADDDADASTSTSPAAPAPAAAAAPAHQVEAPAAVAEARPLVGMGHVLVAHWDEDAYERFFGGDASQWSATQEVVQPELAERRAQGRGGAKKVITLADCLGEFTKEERLGEDDMWYCGACKEHKQATKKVELWKVPDVLVFALKRFSSSRYSRDKIDDLVDFPIDGLDLTEWVEGDKVEHRLADEMGDAAPSVTAPDSLTYDLYAVSNHFGGLGGGHYTAFAKNHENGRWYDFDDSRVSEIQPDR
ncbi:uncharacterized protein RHOBADRAFT_37429, partial [Rhodotorula graminis WP1]